MPLYSSEATTPGAEKAIWPPLLMAMALPSWLPQYSVLAAPVGSGVIAVPPVPVYVGVSGVGVPLFQPPDELP